MTVQRSEKEEILEALREFRQRLEDRAASDDEAREMVTAALEAEAALEAT